MAAPALSELSSPSSSTSRAMVKRSGLDVHTAGIVRAVVVSEQAEASSPSGRRQAQALSAPGSTNRKNDADEGESHLSISNGT